MHINQGVHDVNQVLILACVPLKYELKININFGTIRFQMKWNGLCQVDNFRTSPTDNGEENFSYNYPLCPHDV